MRCRRLMMAPLSVTVSSIVSVVGIGEAARRPSRRRSVSPHPASAIWPLATVIWPPPLTVAFSISLEAMTDSVPVSSMMPPSIVTASSVRSAAAHRVVATAIDRGVLDLARSDATDSVPVSSMVPPLMVAPSASVTVDRQRRRRCCRCRRSPCRCPGQCRANRHRAAINRGARYLAATQ